MMEFLSCLPATLTETPDSQLSSQQPVDLKPFITVDSHGRITMDEYQDRISENNVNIERTAEEIHGKADTAINSALSTIPLKSATKRGAIKVAASQSASRTTANTSRKTYSRPKAGGCKIRKATQTKSPVKVTKVASKTSVIRASTSASDTLSTSSDSMPSMPSITSAFQGPCEEASQRTNYDSPPPLPAHRPRNARPQRKSESKSAAKKRPKENEDDEEPGRRPRRQDRSRGTRPDRRSRPAPLRTDKAGCRGWTFPRKRMLIITFDILYK